MRFIVSIVIFFSVVLGSVAQSVNDTIVVKGDNMDDRVARDLDSLVNTWYVKIAVGKLPRELTGDSLGLEEPDSVYIARLSKINSIIRLPYNSIVRNHIHVYTIRQREKFSAVLGLKDYYFPMIEDVFDSYGLPTELEYMAVIESALNPNAVSRAGATGL